MNHAAVPDPPGFEKLSRAEQIRYVQALWDRITGEGDEIPAPDSHLLVAEKRLEAYRRNPERARPAYEALDELTKTRK